MLSSATLSSADFGVVEQPLKSRPAIASRTQVGTKVFMVVSFTTDSVLSPWVTATVGFSHPAAGVGATRGHWFYTARGTSGFILPAVAGERRRANGSTHTTRATHRRAGEDGGQNEEVSQSVDRSDKKRGPCRASARVFPYIVMGVFEIPACRFAQGRGLHS